MASALQLRNEHFVSLNCKTQEIIFVKNEPFT